MPNLGLFREHPPVSPDLTGPADYLMNPPSIFAANAHFINFRDEAIIPLIAARPDNPDFPNYLKNIEAILTWRATIAPEDRFWRTDESYAEILRKRREQRGQ